MRGHRSGQQGAILVLTAFLLPFIILFTGFAVDAGNAYMHHSKLQNSADAAVLAGAHKYAENKSKPDTQAKVEEYMKLNQGDTPYKVDPPVYTEKDKTHTKITVHASQELPTFFLGAAYKLLSKAFDDESLDKWEISVTASALITKNTSNTPNTPKIFDYAMIGGRVGKANEGNSEQDALIFSGNHMFIKGSVHTNGAVRLDDNTYVQAEKFSCLANNDAELWSRYRNNYNEHYLNGVDSKWDNMGHQYFYDEMDEATYKAHINPGHENDDKIILGEGRRNFTWRYYYRIVTSDKKDYIGDQSHSSKIDISLSQTNQLTSDLYDLIYNKYKKIPPSELKKNHIYMNFDDSSVSMVHHDTVSEYPGLVKDEWNDPNAFYRIIIVNGDLNISLSNAGPFKNNQDHMLLVSLNGNILITGNSPFYGYVYAPHGKVHFNEPTKIYGSIVADTIQFNGSNINIEHRNFEEGSSGGNGSSSGNSGTDTGTTKISLISDDS